MFSTLSQEESITVIPCDRGFVAVLQRNSHISLEEALEIWGQLMEYGDRI
jgi:hypothetical protein